MREGLRFYNGEVLLGFMLGLLYLCDYSIVPIRASIHEYRNEFFTPQLNAFLFHGGSEGLFASKHHQNHDDHSSIASPGNKPLEGKSFIRILAHVPEALLQLKGNPLLGYAKKFNLSGLLREQDASDNLH